jgi:hypothetical protein
MSSSIWTESAGSSEIGPLALDAWRVVEAQHRVSTRKLVDSDAEQAVLESVLDAHKPPVRRGGGLHYLLFTPFRYPPLRRGTRFGARYEPSLWYGSEAVRTAMAEVAYYRLLFLEGTTADLGLVETDLSAFRVPVKTRRGVDLTSGVFARWRSRIASKTSYASSQPLGAAMREDGVEAFRYESARDGEGGVSAGLFTPDAFGARRPAAVETWYCAATREAVECRRRDYFSGAALRFPRGPFLVRGDLPRPAV